ncbi:MAG: hypothetical protein GWP91_03250 [Rhodobacterales bacterium]|nr:hypothetical protein [Rhodobacterales bacterium]
MDPISAINGVCRRAFHLALLLGVATIALAPLHMQGTQNVDIIQVLPGNRVAIRPTNTARVQVGDELPVYRFNPGWKAPIGHVVVAEKGDERWIASYEPSNYSWPMGIQGMIIGQADAGRVTLNLGRATGLTPGKTLSVFKDRFRLGELRVVDVGDNHSEAIMVRWQNGKPTSADLKGLVVNEFQVANQVAWFENALQEWIDALVYGVLLSLWFWSLVSQTPGSLFFYGAARLRYWGRKPPAPLRHTATLLLGVPLVYVGGTATWYGATRTLGWITEVLRRSNLTVPMFPSWPPPGSLPLVGAFFQRGTFLGDHHILPTTLVLGVAWVAWLTMRRSSPALEAWRRMGFHPLPLGPGKRPSGILARPLYWLWSQVLIPIIGRFWLSKPEPLDESSHKARLVARGLVNWTLHLFVFYAFASTLSGFLLGNLTAIGTLGWRSAHLNFHTLNGFGLGLFTMLTQLPELGNAHDLFQLLRLTLWTLTISGCLLGYGHTVVSVIWKPTAIRSIDLTPWAWLFNAICYAPLLGGILHHLAPHQIGVDPYVTVGAYFWMAQLTELLLNLLYTLSIWNLGTMFGVMVDKGVRWNGFYSVVRHPSYTLEPLMFVILELNAFTTPAGWLAASAYPIKYWLRSERDDQFMGNSNPEYVEFRKATRWKFIPGLY